MTVHVTAGSLQSVLNNLPCLRHVEVTRAVYVLTGDSNSRFESFSAADNRLTTTALTAAQCKMLVKGARIDVDGAHFAVRVQPLEGSFGIDVEQEHGVLDFASNRPVLKLDESGSKRGPFGYEWTISFENDAMEIVDNKYPGLQLLPSLSSIKTSSALLVGTLGIKAGQAAIPPEHYGYFEINNDKRVCDTYTLGVPSSAQMVQLFGQTTATAETFKLKLGNELTDCITLGKRDTASNMKKKLEALDFVSKVTVKEVRAFKILVLAGSATAKVTGYDSTPKLLTIVSTDSTVMPHGGLTADKVAVLLKDTIIRVSRNSYHSKEQV